MGFAVAHEGGTKDKEYQAYARLLSRQLLQRGVSLDNLPRVPADGSPYFWLYVWDNEPEAAAFAKELKKQTRDAHWLIQPVKAKPSMGPLRPLQIHVGRQGDGWVFGLEPLTKIAIQTKFPQSCRHRSVFIGSERGGEFVETQEDLARVARQVLSLLTSLDQDQLRTFGSFRVVEPVEEEQVVPPTSLE
jgi:hypothetical protein